MARKEFLELAQQLAIALDGWNKTLQPALTKFTVAVKEYQPRLEEILSQTAKVFKQLPEWQLYVLEVLARGCLRII